jgi:hypothetical protein
MQRAIPDRLHDAEHVDIAEERSAPLDRGKLHRREELFQFPGQLTADVLIEVKAHGKCDDLANHTRWSTVLLGVGVAFKIYYIMAWPARANGLPTIRIDARGVFQRAAYSHRIW